MDKMEPSFRDAYCRGLKFSDNDMDTDDTRMTSRRPYDMETDECSVVDMTNATLSQNGKKKVNKPLMERRRRARINQSLTELKSLVLDGMKKDPARYSRLEKADVMDMTVIHLKTLQKKALEASSSQQESLEKYKAGFLGCTSEVSRYLGENNNLDANLRNRLIEHLKKRANSLTIDSLPKPPQATTPDGRPVASVSPMSPQPSSTTSVEGSPKVVYGNVQLVMNANNSNSQRLRMILPKHSPNTPDSRMAARAMSPSSDEDQSNANTSHGSDVTLSHSPAFNANLSSSSEGSLAESEDDSQLAAPLVNQNQISVHIPAHQNETSVHIPAVHIPTRIVIPTPTHAAARPVQEVQNAPLNLSAPHCRRVEVPVPVVSPASMKSWRPW